MSGESSPLFKTITYPAIKINEGIAVLIGETLEVISPWVNQNTWSLLPIDGDRIKLLTGLLVVKTGV